MLKRVCVIGVLLVSSVSAFAERVITPPPYNNMEGKRLSSIECLSVNAFHESRSQSDLANLMIMATVLNRVNDRRWARSICGVVFQKASFSWVNDSLSDEINDLAQYRRLYRLAEHFLINRDLFLKMSGGSNHYHLNTITPYWVGSERMKWVMTVDDHLFYEWVDKARYRK